MIFDNVYGDVFEKILEMKNEKSALDKAGRELEGKIKTLYAQFAAMLGSGTKGKCVADGCEYLITYKPSYRTLIPKEAMEWTIVNKVDTIYKEKCRVQLLSAVPSTILLFHLVSSFRENYAVSWHYRILRCIRIQITGVPAENDMFYG